MMRRGCWQRTGDKIAEAAPEEDELARRLAQLKARS